MSFGPIMRLRAGELHIELAPLSRNDMPRYIENGGMQSHTVTQFLGRRTAPVLEDEHEWFDKTRTDKNVVMWGIWVNGKGGRTLIGSSSLHNIDDWNLRICVSGSVIFEPSYWGKGIGSHCHKARTWYGFRQLRLDAIRSSALLCNERSWRALVGSGYAQVGIVRNSRFVNGRFEHELNLECINPDPHVWRQWWHGDRVPAVFQQARKNTQAALEWADAHVQLL